MSDLADLLLRGSDDDIRAAGRDASRPKITTAEAIERLTALVKASGMTMDEAVASIRANMGRPDVSATIRACPACGHTWHDEGA